MTIKLSVSAKITTIAAALLAFILALVPFHAFLTVWASTVVGHYTLLRIWEEAAMLLLMGAAVCVLVRDRQLWHELKNLWLFRVALAYAGLHFLLGGVALTRHQVNGAALVYALIVNLRPVTFFFIAWVLAAKAAWLRRYVGWLIIAPAMVVIIFGLLQAFVLPHDVLRHIGYGPATIQPYETVDQKLQYVRVQSTLRGANPLGAYLVVVLVVGVAWLMASYNKRKKYLPAAILAGVAGLLVLYLTYSRSAYIGLAIAVVFLGWLGVKSKRAKQYTLIAVAAFCLICAGGFLVLRHNDRFENTFFHTDEHSKSSQSSNQARSSALEQGIHDVVHEPLGRGPGTAGPASVHNNHPVRIAEDYYLQIGQELGWVGLFLFIATNVFVARLLWLRRDDFVAAALLASLLGVSFINLLSHAWTDDTLAIVWWGVTGIVLAPDILKRKDSRHAKIQEKTRQA